FVTKLNAAGSAFVYSSYLGEITKGIAVDAAGCAYLTGHTGGGIAITAGAFQTTPGGNQDAFVTKLNATGSALVYSTYLGGSSDDYGFGVAVDNAGCAYVTGRTYPSGSTPFPTTAGAFQATPYGGWVNEEAFVTKLNAAGSGLVYSTFLDGSGEEDGYG